MPLAQTLSVLNLSFYCRISYSTHFISPPVHPGPPSADRDLSVKVLLPPLNPRHCCLCNRKLLHPAVFSSPESDSCGTCCSALRGTGYLGAAPVHGPRKLKSAEFPLFHQICHPDELLFCSTVAHVKTRPRRNLRVCTHFVGSEKVVPQQLSNSDNTTVGPRLCIRTGPHQQRPSSGSLKTAKRYPARVWAQHRRKLSKLRVRIWSRTCRSISASITLQILHHQLRRRSLQRSSSVSASSVPLLVSHVDDEVPKRLNLLRSQFNLPAKRQTWEFQNPSAPKSPDC